MAVTNSSVLALDVGAKRVGVAVASLEAKFPRPLITLNRDDGNFFASLEAIVEVENTRELVVGFPRGLQGQHTKQTASIMEFTKELKQHFPLPIHMQDEALTSKYAEDELRLRGKPYDRGDIDALAATYILEDWFKQRSEKKAN